MAKSNTSRTTSKSGAGKSPVDRVRIGRIEAAIWRNESEKSAFYSVTLSRAYRDGEAWKNAASFGRDDLLAASKALNIAHTRVCELVEADRSASADQAA